LANKHLKNKKMKTIIKITGVIVASLILISLWLMFSSFRQKETVELRKQIMHDIMVYAEKQIVPVIQPLRENVEQGLSFSDRMEINSVREQLRKTYDIRKHAGLMPAEIAKSNRELTEEELVLIKETRKQFRKQIMKVWEIADRNEDLISSELDIAKPYIDTWKEEISNITSEQLPVRFMDFIPSAKVALFKQLGLAEDLIPVAFLLYNPDVPLSQLKAALENTTEQTFDINIYPNPVRSEYCFEINLPEAGEVNVSLFDKNGNFIEESFSGQMEKGINKECISLSELPGGFAFVLFSIEGEKIMKSIIIK